jgi:hypothetical protein
MHEDGPAEPVRELFAPEGKCAGPNMAAISLSLSSLAGTLITGLATLYWKTLACPASGLPRTRTRQPEASQNSVLTVHLASIRTGWATTQHH